MFALLLAAAGPTACDVSTHAARSDPLFTGSSKVVDRPALVIAYEAEIRDYRATLFKKGVSRDAVVEALGRLDRARFAWATYAHSLDVECVVSRIPTTLTPEVMEALRASAPTIADEQRRGLPIAPPAPVASQPKR